ncbi:MAG: DUF2115 domain-containing protein [Methanolinea sp.]|nr:DUF2115 domain-containing protein [Methanolinea sp.]
MDGKEACEYEQIVHACQRLSRARTRGEAGILMAREISSFSLFDLSVIMGRARYEVHRLPPPYRKVAAPYLLGQIADAHHELLSLCTQGYFSRLTQLIRERDAYVSYCAMVPRGCFASEPGREYLPQFHSAKHRLFFYILAGFSMFVMEKPGHPVGTPFPGGLRVREENGRYYCPVRDKQKDVFFAICNFCPALQDNE